MQTRTINAEHLQLVLVTLRMRRHNEKLARFCALSNGATWQRCQLRHRPTDESKANVWVHKPLMVPMLESVSVDLVKRTRLHYGLAEVKATWGKGYKELLRELDTRKKGGQP
jgi:hypothetical protein